jgi:hypothetical protein
MPNCRIAVRDQRKKSAPETSRGGRHRVLRLMPSLITTAFSLARHVIERHLIARRRWSGIVRLAHPARCIARCIVFVLVIRRGRRCTQPRREQWQQYWRPPRPAAPGRPALPRVCEPVWRRVAARHGARTPKGRILPRVVSRRSQRAHGRAPRWCAVRDLFLILFSLHVAALISGARPLARVSEQARQVRAGRPRHLPSSKRAI